MINKIKITPDMVAIDYSVEFFSNEEQELKINKYTVESPEAPVMDFSKTLQGLDFHLIELCELANKTDDIAVMCQDVEITGVSFKWKEGTFGAVISGQKVLAYSQEPLVLNSPMKLAPPDEPLADDEKPKFDSMIHLKPTTVTMLKKLIEHAENYVNGIRAQVDITFEERQDKANNEVKQTTIDENDTTTPVVGEDAVTSIGEPDKVPEVDEDDVAAEKKPDKAPEIT